MKYKVPIILAAIALIRPFFSIVGLTEYFGQPYTSITLTLIISLIWICTVVISQDKKPIQTLVMAGIFYAIFAIVISGILSPILLGELRGPLLNPLAIISVFITNIIWGLIVGCISWVIMKVVY